MSDPLDLDRLDLGPLDLDRRRGWPPELLGLLRHHPRASWAGHPDLGATGQFWLERHDAFRQFGAALQRAAEGFRDGKAEAAEFQDWFAPRLQLLLSELQGHHQVEDLHYFPVFRAAEPGLAAGFEVLARDHETLHLGLIETAEAANGLLQALARDPAAAQGPADSYVAAGARLLGRLQRHLDDEEDLVIPLLIERGEAGLVP